MKFQKLKVKNFQSISDIVFDFPEGLCLIDGWNHDLDDANGVGKSSLLNGIVFALYGKVPYNAKKSDLLKDGATSIETEISLVVKSQEVVIQRTTKPNKVRLCVDGEEFGGLAKDVNSKIVEVLGLDFNQFVQICYIYQDSLDRFIDLNDTAKKEFLTQVLGLDKYSAAYKEVKNRSSALEKELAKVEGALSYSGTTIQNFKDQVSSSKSDLSSFLESKEDVVKEKTAEVKSLKADIEDKLSEIVRLKRGDKIKDLTIKKNEVSEKHMAYRKLLLKEEDFQAKASKKDREIASLKRRLDNPPSKCEECGQELLNWDRDEWDRVQSEKIDQSKKDLERLNSKLADIKGVLDRVPDFQLEISKIEEELALEKSRVNKLEYEVKLAKSNLDSISEFLNGLDSHKQILESTLKKSEILLQEALDKEVELKAKVKDLSSRKKLLLLVKKVFSPSGIKAYVFDSVIASLNDRISDYLDVLFNGLVQFEYTHDENGKLVEECVYSGVPRSTSVLSGGEKRRLSLAVDIALSDVVSERLDVYPDFLILDEATKGMAPVGLEKTMMLLQDLQDRKTTILVVDHASEFKTSFTNKVFLEKRNDVTLMRDV